MNAVQRFQKHKEAVNTHGTQEAELLTVLERASAAWRHGRTTDTVRALAEATTRLQQYLKNKVETELPKGRQDG